jgi:hypothetical protein
MLHHFILCVWHGFSTAFCLLGRVDVNADGVGGLSWGGVINSGIGGRQRLKMLNGRNGSDFQFVRDCAQWMVSLVKNVVGSQRDAIL